MADGDLAMKREKTPLILPSRRLERLEPGQRTRAGGLRYWSFERHV